MPESITVVREYKQPEKYSVSDKDWNAPRFSDQEAQKIATSLGGVIQFRPADQGFLEGRRGCGLRDAGYIVKIGYGYLYSINKELCGIK